MAMYARDRLCNCLCPTSNLFWAVAFPLKKHGNSKLKSVSGPTLGQDLVWLFTVNESTKVQQLQGDKLSAFESLYHATLGSAKALDLDDKLGNFNGVKEADLWC